VVIVLPQGTIPQGDAFFDPVLRARSGVARMAADSGAPVVPVALWGTERVWPRSARLPNLLALRHPPTVTVRVGPPVPLGHEDLRADSATVMAAIVALLPETTPHAPSAAELARTYPRAGRRPRPTPTDDR
jgi:putative phosphoserine phosphatase / 1-acylglycerol-3-phosphate O-acyltransferase